MSNLNVTDILVAIIGAISAYLAGHRQGVNSERKRRV